MSLVPDSLSASKVRDVHDRPLGSLRLSVTDRCNLRCQYCMPEEDYVWLPREDVLSFEERATLPGYFADLGVDKVRLPGGEPLLRRDLSRLVRLLLQDRRISEIALTTNGILLADNAQELYEAGLHRVTVSLDTLRPERFRQLTRRDEFARVIDGKNKKGKKKEEERRSQELRMLIVFGGWGFPASQFRTFKFDSVRFRATAFASAFKHWRTQLAATLENCK